jgi:hypothetical protein
LSVLEPIIADTASSDDWAMMFPSGRLRLWEPVSRLITHRALATPAATPPVKRGAEPWFVLFLAASSSNAMLRSKSFNIPGRIAVVGLMPVPVDDDDDRATQVVE